MPASIADPGARPPTTRDLLEFLNPMRCIGTDEQLIEQYLTGTRGDAEYAFEALVKRHGPVVMGTCRQVLHRREDAEDAFQATFLELARKASTIRDRRLLVSWLYEVAHRIAMRMRYRARLYPAPLATVDRATTSGEPESVATRGELRRRLHAEVASLPEKYRFLVEQCYLQGKSNQEVARLLGRPVGSVKGWLARARGMMRERLSGAAPGRDDDPHRDGKSPWA
jgi:RNA polymerase sigma factor (sigma-70 family)